MILLVTLFLLPNLALAFFGLGGGSGGCGCPQPACPPPAPPPVCAPPPQLACSPSPCAVARGVKTEQAAHVALPDELELRAAAFGVPVHHQPQQAPSNIEQLEKLVERYEPLEGNKDDAVILAEPETPHEADLDLMRAGLQSGSDIRRAPTVNISHQEEVEPTTVAASTEAPEADKVKGEEEISQNKCNSQVLHKLMFENINDNSSESKRKINAAAEEKFGGNVDVICSRGHFSYVFSSNLYCEATKGLTTCIAFRQAV